jgi:hypothetical protein
MNDIGEPTVKAGPTKGDAFRETGGQKLAPAVVKPLESGALASAAPVRRTNSGLACS